MRPRAPALLRRSWLGLLHSFYRVRRRQSTHNDLYRQSNRLEGTRHVDKRSTEVKLGKKPNVVSKSLRVVGDFHVLTWGKRAFALGHA